MNKTGNNDYPLKFPFEIKAIDPVVNEKLLKGFVGKIFGHFITFETVIFATRTVSMSKVYR